MTETTPYSLHLLAEYTHTLDSLPHDLLKSFADLREVDAVLSSLAIAITTKIDNLTKMIEAGALKEEMLWLLTEIADDAERLKHGEEDKIRFACQAADDLKSHSLHLRALSDHIPAFDSSILNRKTVYPHISDQSYVPPAIIETGRRRRGVLGSIMTNQDPSPNKRKRGKEDDVDIGSSRTPKKPVNADGNSRARNNARSKKNDRAASPAESLVSVTSHLPPQIGHSTSGRAGNGVNARSNAVMSANSKRSRGGANSHNRNQTPNESYPTSQDPHGHINGSRQGGTAHAYNGPPSASHPSLPTPYQNGANGNNYDAHGISHNVGLQDWGIPRAQQLEGPGMPIARSSSIHSTNTSLPLLANNNVADTTDAGDGDGDGDDRTYCFCDGPSYGEMIACDDMQCEREWFHIACVGLTVVPAGNWLCEVCKVKKSTKRSVRGGKRRTGGNRAAAKS